MIRPLWLSISYALAALCFAALCVVAAVRIVRTGQALEDAIQELNELAGTAKQTAEKASPKILDTLDSVKAAADEGKEAMRNTKIATKSLQVAADQSQIFYGEQLTYLRSGAVQRTVAEALVGVRNFSALALNANLIARDFRLNSQPKIDEIISEANVAVVKANELFARPSIPLLIDNAARFTGNLAETTAITNSRLPVLLDDAHRLTFAAGGIAESVDTIGKGIVKPRSKKARVLTFFLDRAIQNAPVLFARIRF